jgi:hypothetical protein
MTVSLYIRVSSRGKRRYIPVNKKKIYPDGTVFCSFAALCSQMGRVGFQGWE